MKHLLKSTFLLSLIAAAASTACSDDDEDFPVVLREPTGNAGSGGSPSGGAGGSMVAPGGAGGTGMAVGGGAGTGMGGNGAEENPPLAPALLGDVADGWAGVWADDPDRVTNGGAEADADHIYRVTNRTQLIQALYPDANILENGQFSSELGADPTPKIIYIEGTINLSSNRAGEALTEEDYACEGYDREAYLAEYDPKEWNKQPLVGNDPPEILPCPGTQEQLRDCSSDQQNAVVLIRVGSNTTILGVGADARLINGGLIVGGGSAPVRSSPREAIPEALDADEIEECRVLYPDRVFNDPEPEPEPPKPEPGAKPEPEPPPATIPYVQNVIIRNVRFSDAYDYFAGWEPDDSYNTPPAVADPKDPRYPQCQATFDEATDNGPHHCRGGRWNSRYDNLRIQNSANVWIDHCTFDDAPRLTQQEASLWEFPYDEFGNRYQPHDGLLDIVNATDFVTVSYNTFDKHDKVTVIGGSDTEVEGNGLGRLSVTIHHNQYLDNGQRTPRVRYGKVHIYSNFTKGSRPSSELVPAAERLPAPMGSAINAGHLSQIYSESNVFEVAGFPGESEPSVNNIITTAHREPRGIAIGQSTTFTDIGSTLNGEPVDLNEAVRLRVADRGDPEIPASTWNPADVYEYTVSPVGELKSLLEGNTGVGVLEVVAPTP